MKLFLILFSLAFALASANEKPQSANEPSQILAGGEPGKAPYVVGIYMGWTGRSKIEACTGAIISETFVLTAGQCLTSDYVDIRYGSEDYIQKRISNSNFIIYESSPARGDDIGLIRVPRLEFSQSVNKVNLPKTSYDRFNNKKAVECSWGALSNEELQCVDQTVISNYQCSFTYGHLSTGVLCTLGDGTFGEGKTGAPLVTEDANPTLAGIASFFSGKVSDPAGFTNVATHLEWILDQIN